MILRMPPMIPLAALLAVTSLAVVPGSLAQPGTDGRHIDMVRSLYIDAVYERVTVDSVVAVASDESLRVDDPAWHAYLGGLTVLRARDSRWPFRKLRYTRRGLETLDELVANHPANLELRFVRLMSCIRLPRFLNRTWSVEADYQALASGHENLKNALPPNVYDEVVSIVRLAEHEAASSDAELDSPRKTDEI